MVEGRDHIHFVTDRDHVELSLDDQILASVFAKWGVSVSPMPWEDPRSLSGHCLIRSPWNYPSQADAFKSWLSQRECRAHTTLNESSLALWNIDKRYLIDLAERGADIVDTVHVTVPGQIAWDRCVEVFGTSDLVIKPLVGNSGNGVQRVCNSTEFAAWGVSCIVQPYVPYLSTGEVSLVFVEGEYSHSARRIPREGEFRANTSLGARAEAYEPTQGEVDAATRTLRLLTSVPLFARIDGYSAGGRFVTSEVELIEPGLFFRFAPTSSLEMFVSATLERLRDRRK